jgi:hypothetical protein
LGEVERVPLKVVPIFVTPIDDQPEPPEEQMPAEEAEEDAPRKPTSLIGLTAVALALATIGVHIAAIVVASGGDFPTGTTLGYLAVGLSALAVVVGILAAIVGRGRAWGIGAAIIAVLANPWVLLVVLRFLSGLQTS